MLWRSPTLVARLRTVDLSLGGARVYTDDRLKIGQKLELDLLVSKGRTVRVLARVVWVDELPAAGPARYDVGVEFLEVPEEMRSRLSQVLACADRHPDEGPEALSSRPPPGESNGSSGQSG
jgi:c-di-GMP-binding flagellar brake protein YcgR